MTATAAIPAPRRAGGVLGVAAGAAFLALLDTTVANLAVADVQGDFAGTSVGAATWIITIYAVVFAACLAPAGRVADVVGRRTLLLAGVSAFTVLSLACALAPSLGVLLGARALQGAAAAAMIPASLAVVLADTPPERRAAAIGAWSAAGALAAAAGPAIGGVLVDTVGWRALFLINVPIGFAIVLGTRALPSGGAGGRFPTRSARCCSGSGSAPRPWASRRAGVGERRRSPASRAPRSPWAVALWRSFRHAAPGARDAAVALAAVRGRQPRLAALRRGAVPVDARRRPVPRRHLGLHAARGRPGDDAGRDHRVRRRAPRAGRSSRAAARRRSSPAERWS